jgi:hypothetical protein
LLENLAKTEFGKLLLSKAIQFQADGSYCSVNKPAYRCIMLYRLVFVIKHTNDLLHFRPNKSFLDLDEEVEP